MIPVHTNAENWKLIPFYYYEWNLFFYALQLWYSLSDYDLIYLLKSSLRFQRLFEPLDQSISLGVNNAYS